MKTLSVLYYKLLLIQIFRGLKMLKKLALIFPLVISMGIYSQDAEKNDSDVEEVVVLGSQIKGARITGALPVSIISSDEIDAFGIDSGEELLDNIAEFGQNLHLTKQTKYHKLLQL